MQFEHKKKVEYVFVTIPPIKTNVVLSVKLISHHINRNWIKKLFTFQIDAGMTDLKRVVSLALPSISELLSLNCSRGCTAAGHRVI